MKDPIKRPKPLTWHEHNELVLPKEENPLQKCLDELYEFTVNQKMSINKDKTKVMIFNMSKKYQFPPELNLTENEILEVVEEAKVLGVILSINLKWTKNTDYIAQKAMKNICIVRRMKKLGFDKHILNDIYQKEIRSILEFAVPVWTGSLTDHDSDRIENIQRKVFKLILQTGYISYEDACKKFNCDTLKDRRRKLCLNFSKKEYKKEPSIFTKFEPVVINRHTHKKIVKEFLCQTDRLYNSSLPFLSRLLNKDNASKQ